MTGVTARGAGAVGVAGQCGPVGLLVDLEAQVRDDAWLRLVADVDDPAGTDALAVAGDPVAVVGELIGLDQVGLAADRHRKRRLGDGHARPGDLPQHLDLRVECALLDLADVEHRDAVELGGSADLVAGEAGAGGEVGPRAVVADGQRVGVVVADEHDARDARIGQVDGGHRASTERDGVEGLAVGGEPALVPEDPGRRAGQQHRRAAVGAEVVDVDLPGCGHRVARDRSHQTAGLVDQHRLVRALEGRGLQRRRADRLARVAHVEHERAGR